MDASASRDEMIDAKSRVRSMLDNEAFEHVNIDVELQGEICMIGDGHGRHAEAKPHDQCLAAIC